MTNEPKLTFAQREGAAALPEQLKPGELSQQLRAMLWAPLHADIKENISSGQLWYHWRQILLDYHVEVLHLMPEDFFAGAAYHQLKLSDLFKSGGYVEVLDFTEWLLRSPKCKPPIKAALERAFVVSRCAYRVVDHDTIVSVSDGHEATALIAGIAATAPDEFAGTRAHLKNAAQELRNGRLPESVRESIHAVEAIAKTLEPGANGFAAALSKLEIKFGIHGALKSGFASLYGFTSDAKGIRHSLGDVAAADVDEADAIYMLGACASFVSYLISKTRTKK